MKIVIIVLRHRGFQPNTVHFITYVLFNKNINNIDIFILLCYVIFLKAKTEECKMFQYNLIIMEFIMINQNDTMITKISCRVGSLRYQFIVWISHFGDILYNRREHKPLYAQQMADAEHNVYK